MAVPDLSLRMALETPDRVDDGMGGHRLVWRQLGWLWAGLEARSAREKGSGPGMISVVQWKILVRGAAVGDPRRPRPGQRLRVDQRLFLIEAVAEADPLGRFLDCFAREEMGA